jgi:two-component system, NtrC family, nitrogen regulation sensor histidine kinase NtrY
MVFKTFIAGIAFRIVILLATCYLIGWIGFRSDYIHTIIMLYILLGLEIAWIIHYFNKTNRMLDRFFSSIFESGSAGFGKLDGNASFKRLIEKMEKLTQLIQATRIEKENEYYYLKYVVDHLNTGLLSLISTGEIDMINQAGLGMLGLKQATHQDDLKILGKKFCDALHEIRAGEQQITQAVVQHEMIELSLRASEFKLFDRHVKLVTFHDIHIALDQKELDAWQKVIRVMAHEILSSVSPIRSLSEHLNNLLVEDNLDSAQKFSDVREGLGIINQRSEGLMQYVSGYRQLSDIPRPDPVNIGVLSLIRKIATLCNGEFKISPVLDLSGIHDEAMIMADERLIVQAALNIIRNSVQAMEKVKIPRVDIAVKSHGNKVHIHFMDNGMGIDPEDIDNVFIPFFTTKSGGSGIGLTISRQLLNIQGGQLEIQSRKGHGTKVTMTFAQSR